MSHADDSLGSELPSELLAAKAELERQGGEALRTDLPNLQHVISRAQHLCGLDKEAMASSEAALAASPAARKQTLQLYLDILQQHIQGAEEELSGKRRELASLAPGVTRRRTWRFAKEEDAFLHDSLKGLQVGVPAFESREVSFVRDRQLRWARFLLELEQNAEHRAAWQQARKAIEDSPSYATLPKLALAPQRGLLPIGENPTTKLWEFYHLRSAWDGQVDPKEIEIPRHDAKGHIPVDEKMGIVFVLLPLRTTWLGAQSEDPTGRNYDPLAKGSESVLREVTLGRWFIARHELTQGQWARLAALDDEFRPSRYRAGASNEIGGVVLESHPVENVTWPMCQRLLDRWGLELPTEEQWEFACRAGTDTPWWCGATRESLEGVANLADATAARAGARWPAIQNWIDDGYAVHAPVDALRANPWGLHHVHGNVWEWCTNASEKDQLRGLRGGSFPLGAMQSRSAFRAANPPTFRA